MRLLLARAAGPDSAGPDTTGPDRAGEAAGPADRRDVDELAELCRMLGGIPLAIELAAARLAHLPAGVVAAGLGKRLARHEGSPGAITPERRLRAVIDWTYELLRAGRAAAVGGSVGVHRGLRSSGPPSSCTGAAGRPPRTPRRCPG